MTPAEELCALLGGDPLPAPAPVDRSERQGRCDTCKRERTVRNDGTAEFPNWRCGSCAHRQARATNTREMYGHGRRGY